MPTSQKPDAISILASLAEASNRPPNRPPETDETKPRPWEAPQLVAESDEDLEEIPLYDLYWNVLEEIEEEFPVPDED